MKKDLDYYMSLNYEVHIKKTEEGEYFATIEDLPGCMATAATKEDALAAIEEAKLGWLGAALKSRVSIKEPEAKYSYSGKILVRTHPDLHRVLVMEAEAAGISLNLYLNLLLMQNRSIMELPHEGSEPFGEERSEHYHMNQIWPSRQPYKVKSKKLSTAHKVDEVGTGLRLIEGGAS